jgi:hypothetical protein
MYFRKMRKKERLQERKKEVKKESRWKVGCAFVHTFV